MINVKQIVGKNVVIYRKKQHLTQEQLAGLINIAPPSLSKIENGYTFPNSSTFEDLIKHLKIKPYQLFLFDEKELKIEDKELQALIIEKFKCIDFDKRKIIFTIIDALSGD